MENLKKELSELFEQERQHSIEEVDTYFVGLHTGRAEAYRGILRILENIKGGI